MQQAVDLGKDLHKGPEVHNAHHPPPIELAHLRLRGKQFYLTDGGVAGGLVHGPNYHRAIILDVDGGPGLIDDPADVLAAGADEVANPVHWNLKDGELGGIGGELLAGLGDGTLHVVQYLKPGIAGLAKCLGED